RRSLRLRYRGVDDNAEDLADRQLRSECAVDVGRAPRSVREPGQLLNPSWTVIPPDGDEDPFVAAEIRADRFDRGAVAAFAQLRPTDFVRAAPHLSCVRAEVVHRGFLVDAAFEGHGYCVTGLTPKRIHRDPGIRIREDCVRREVRASRTEQKP